jgi:hypothetical protein
LLAEEEAAAVAQALEAKRQAQILKSTLFIGFVLFFSSALTCINFQKEAMKRMAEATAAAQVKQ